MTPTATGTRLTLTLDRETNYRYQVLEQARPGGEPVKRLYIDLDNTRTGPRLPSEKRYDSGNGPRYGLDLPGITACARARADQAGRP